MEIVSLHVYPVKSCGGIEVDQVLVEARGFQWDRHWMIVKPNGEKVTQRERPMLAQVKTRLTKRELILNHSEVGEFRIQLDKIPLQKMQVQIWGHRCHGLDEGESAGRWFSKVCGERVLLVRFDRGYKREIDPFWVGKLGSHTAFADVFPLHLTSMESLEAWNEERKRAGLNACLMNRFRPNMVLKGVLPYAEDSIPALGISRTNLKLEIVRPCSRCQMTNVDQDHGSVEQDGNLQLLVKHRLFKNHKGRAGAMFGVQAIVSSGVDTILKVGDRCESLPLLKGLLPVPRLF